MTTSSLTISGFIALQGKEEDESVNPSAIRKHQSTGLKLEISPFTLGGSATSVHRNGHRLAIDTLTSETCRNDGYEEKRGDKGIFHLETDQQWFLVSRSGSDEVSIGKERDVEEVCRYFSECDGFI